MNDTRPHKQQCLDLHRVYESQNCVAYLTNFRRDVGNAERIEPVRTGLGIWAARFPSALAFWRAFVSRPLWRGTMRLATVRNILSLFRVKWLEGFFGRLSEHFVLTVFLRIRQTTNVRNGQQELVQALEAKLPPIKHVLSHFLVIPLDSGLQNSTLLGYEHRSEIPLHVLRDFLRHIPSTENSCSVIEISLRYHIKTFSPFKRR